MKIQKPKSEVTDTSAPTYYARRIALDLCLVSIVTLVLVSLFEKGPLFVGDYVSAPQIDPLTQFINLFKSIDLNSRNAGYGFRPYIVGWELGSSFVVSAAFSSILGDPGYAKLVILFYLILGALGMNHLLSRILPYNFTDSDWRWQASIRVLSSLFYSTNPAVQQLLAKGYVGILATIGFLPWVILSYDSLTRARTRKSMVVKAMSVAMFSFLGASYTYPLLMVALTVFSYEVSRLFFSRYRGSGQRALADLSLVAIFSTLLELPSIYAFRYQSGSTFLTSFYSGANLAGFYYGSSSPVSVLSVLTLTSSSWTTSYFQQFYLLWYEAFVISMIVVLAVGLFLHFSRGWNAWKLCVSSLLLVSSLLALGAQFLPNLWLFEMLPVFPEPFQFLPLVAFSIVAIVATAFLQKNASILKSIPNSMHSGRKLVAFVLLLLPIVTSLIPLALASASNLSPTAIPDYDQHAYQWLAAQPGDGRVFLIPPSYAVRYPFDSNSYGVPIDYWTISPPKPLIIDNGGSLNGLERLLPYAIYNAKSGLLDYLLSALAVKYVVLRGDAVSTYDVPDYKNITRAYVANNFPYLAITELFGPITIYENQHFNGVVSAFEYPIIVDGNLTSLTTLAEALSPGIPVLFTQDMTSQQLDNILRLFPSPILLPCSTTCPTALSQYSNHVVVAAPQGVIQTFSLTNTGWKYANLVTDGRASIAIANRTMLEDDFENSTYTGGVWSFTRGYWQTIGGQYQTYNDSYQPYSLTRPPSLLSDFAMEATVTLKSGFGAGLFLNSNSSDITENSYQIQLIPSWHAILLAEYRNGTAQWIRLVNAQLSYDVTYNLAVSYVNSNLVVLVNGEPQLSARIPDLTRNEVGLFATQAEAAFSTFRLVPYDRNATITQRLGFGGEQSSSLRLSQGEVFVSVLNENIRGLFLANSILNMADILSPQIEPIQYTHSALSSWTISQEGQNQSFVVFRFLNTGGWIISPETSSYMAYGYALAFASSPETQLSYDQTYTYLAVISFSLIAIFFLSHISPAAISIGRILRRYSRTGGSSCS